MVILSEKKISELFFKDMVLGYSISYTYLKFYL